MEVKKAVLIGGVAVGGFFLGRALLQPQAPKQSPPPPPKPPSNTENWVLCGYNYTVSPNYGVTRPRSVDRVAAYISLEHNNPLYAQSLAERTVHWGDAFGVPLDLLLAIAWGRTRFNFNMDDELLNRAIQSDCSTPVPVGPFGHPHCLWPVVKGEQFRDLLSLSPQQRLDLAVQNFAAMWRQSIRDTGKLESFMATSTDPRESVCGLVEKSTEYSDLR